MLFMWLHCAWSSGCMAVWMLWHQHQVEECGQVYTVVTSSRCPLDRWLGWTSWCRENFLRTASFGLLHSDNSEECSSHLLHVGSLKSRNFLFSFKHGNFHIYVLKFIPLQLLMSHLTVWLKIALKIVTLWGPQINYWSWEVNIFHVVFAQWKWD